MEAVDKFALCSGAKATAKRFPTNPATVLPMIPSSMQDYFPTRNGNYYGGYAWDYLTGSVPKLPAGFDAPGWGDHARDQYGAIP